PKISNLHHCLNYIKRNLFFFHRSIWASLDFPSLSWSEFHKKTGKQEPSSLSISIYISLYPLLCLSVSFLTFLYCFFLTHFSLFLAHFSLFLIKSSLFFLICYTCFFISLFWLCGFFFSVI
ncbi:hypothetical protein CFOL_v3_11271, partial [Cephalotus follicularis]